jgi:hypothetical protein
MHIVVTLVEGDFLKGACALFNSLVSNGFSGKFVIGFRDHAGMPKDVIDAISKSASARIDWMRVETPMHFGNFKPWFMQDVFERFPEARKVTYMDPDIVCLCPFDWIDSWSDGGPTACADVNWMMPPNHPTRHEWLRLSGLTAQRELELYFNSGFLSVRREDAGFLELWADLIKGIGSRDNPLDGEGDIAQWRKGGRWLPFFSPNQDTLNLALMAWPENVTTLGPDVMGFSATGVLPHALGANKPWRKAYLSQALCGTGPSQADKMFWEYADSPVQVFPWWKVAAKRVAVAAAAALARFYRRN